MSSRKELANAIRALSMDAVQKAKSGHPGAPMGMADIAEVLWNDYMRHNPVNPDWADRDRFVMSKGHATGALYSALCAAGYFPEDWLPTYMQPKSLLNGHPNRNYLPGIETNTGPLGHGFPVATGIAIAGQITGAPYRTYVLTGDGEQQEGSNWEAAMVCGHRKLANLTLIIDRNRLQQGAGTEETSGLDPLDDKYRAFGFEVHEVTALFLINYLANMVFAPFMGRAVGRFGERNALIFEYVGLIAVFLAYGGVYYFGWGVAVAAVRG